MKPFRKILFSMLLLVCSISIKAQSDLLLSNKVNAPENVLATFTADEKISISDFMPNQTYASTSVAVKCTVPVNMQVKFFNADGNMTKIESYTLDKGVNELNMQLDDLEIGTYMVQFYSKEGSAVRRFVKESKTTYTSFNSGN
jgi:hypothetical protein